MAEADGAPARYDCPQMGEGDVHIERDDGDADEAEGETRIAEAEAPFLIVGEKMALRQQIAVAAAAVAMDLARRPSARAPSPREPQIRPASGLDGSA